ncbi:hypothetical protein BDZ89DRAFT_1046631 [Hymenopellis radicata]|nr:hypothetical protein BDZ89DRAFT_1046631 [Hymenopellis radicata]
MVVGALALASMVVAVVSVAALALLLLGSWLTNDYYVAYRRCLPGGQTNECCDQYDTVTNLLQNPLSLPVGVLQVLLGLPLNLVAAVGCVPVVGTVCSQQNLCCPNTQSSGLVFVGCNNVNL